tara:strand:- start:167 stop:706 length:540 start_codon:yes stop_codon:yes gene_type:complete
MAGSEGITLTAASNVIICDPWWNPQVLEQAIDRVHRLGQTKDVVVRYLLSKNTVDERVQNLAGSKHAMATKVLGDGVTTSSTYWKEMGALNSKEMRKLIFGGGGGGGGGGAAGRDDDDDDDSGASGIDVDHDSEDDDEVLGSNSDFDDEEENEEGKKSQSQQSSQGSQDDDSILFEGGW